MTETFPKCGTEAQVNIEPSKPDAINWWAKCPNMGCRTNFFGVYYPNQTAPVIRLENEDSPIQ